MADLTGYPYFNRYKPESNYKLVLPYVGGTIQPRDIIEAQATAQDQITRLGSSLYPNGKILEGCQISVSTSKTRVTITAGKVYLDGWVESFPDSVVTITGVGIEVIGLVKTEEIVTDAEDPNLRNPATNFDQYDPAGSYRLKSTWSWALLNDEIQGVAVSIIGVFTLNNGEIISGKTEDTSSALLNQILSILASRDYRQSGNYIIEGLKLSLISHPEFPLDKKQVVVSSGTARILGNDVVMSLDWRGDLPVSRETNFIPNEVWNYSKYNPSTKFGGQKLLGNRPVASVSSVIASVLQVDGYGESPRITRGTISGGSDQLSKTSVVQILAVNQGGTWDPATESFVGGTTFPPSSYIQDGNKVSWAPLGPEPAVGSTYSVAYIYRASLVKQIVVATQSLNEALVLGSNDTISHPFVCETNDYTGLVFQVTNEEIPDGSKTSDYFRGVDFEVLEDGSIDWYNHQVQEFVVLRTSDPKDVINLSNINVGYSVEKVLSVGSIDAEFDPTVNAYTGGSVSFSDTTDYDIVYENEQWEVDWTPASLHNTNEPSLNTYYKVAILERKFKSPNHPEVGSTYYASYYYWKTVVPGDYLSRDSFYASYDENRPEENQLQHYGLDLQDYVNFWRADNNRNSPYNMRKPYPGSMVEISYNYYLPRYALISYTSEGTVAISLGPCSDNPTEPGFEKTTNSLALGTVYMPADGLNMVLREFGIVTMKVTELQNIKSKVTQTETSLALTALEMQAKSLPVSNKVGVSTSSFINDDVLDEGWPDQKYSIDPDWNRLTLSHTDTFLSTDIDTTLTTGTTYSFVTTLTPTGVEEIAQPSAGYNSSVSVAPNFSNQSLLQTSQISMLKLMPHGDFLSIPRVEVNAVEDSDIWRFSKVSKLFDPSPWFTGGWRGGQRNDQALADTARGTTQTVIGDVSSKSKSSEFLFGLSGNCRQIDVKFEILGGLPDPNALPLNFYLYFGGIFVPVTCLNDTPPGSVPGTFRAKQNKSASGVFRIPPNVPAGKVEVKVVSSPTVINGSEWRFVASTIYNASVEPLKESLYNNCRCNCYSCSRCANCWSCTGRCGTGPVLETLTISDQSRVIKSVQLDFANVSPKYGVYVCVVSTESGRPTCNTIANSMLGRKYVSPQGLVGGSDKLFVFDDPILVTGDTYGILVTGEDGFNLEATKEIAYGRDIRVRTTEYPSMDIYTHQGINNKQFQLGSFWTSTTGTSWIEDLKRDLTFRVQFNTYSITSTSTVYMKPVDVVNATAFICAWNSQVPKNTNITFEYTTGDGVWNEFFPFVLTQLNSVASEITVRALLSTGDPKVTPFVENSCSLYVQSQDTRMYAVTDLFSLNPGESANELDIWIDSHLVSNYTQKIRVSFNNGVTWVDLDQPDGGLTGLGYTCSLVSRTPVNENEGEETYTYHWKVMVPPQSYFTSFRTEFNFLNNAGTVTTNSPFMSNYIAIPSMT